MSRSGHQPTPDGHLDRFERALICTTHSAPRVPSHIVVSAYVSHLTRPATNGTPGPWSHDVVFRIGEDHDQK
jgi:hypothetical protein